jgi:hypothetical protein
MADGVRLFSLGCLRQLALLPPGRPIFRSAGDELLISGAKGLQRWTIVGRVDDDKLRIGPPRIIVLPAPPTRTDGDRTGETLAIVSEKAGRGLLFDVATNTVRYPLFEHPQACYVALSRDGRWVATSGWHSDRIRLWNTATGETVKEWNAVMAKVFFTPDSRALIISERSELSFHDLESLKPIRRIRREASLYPGHVAFSPDGPGRPGQKRLMALEIAPGIIHLKDAATDRTVATLEDPHGDRAGWMSFTPDGTQLVSTAPYAKAVHVWDLREIRQKLGDMGLDWDWPEIPLTAPKRNVSTLAEVEVLVGERDDPKRTIAEESQQAIELRRQEWKAKPHDANANNNLAWEYLTAPIALRDVKAALPLAEQAVRLAPRDPIFANTLGAALYRAGRFRDAVTTLQPNIEKQHESSLAFDLYLLAMCHHRLGETVRARDYYDWATRWSRTYPGLNVRQLRELDGFRTEASALLGVQATKN